MNKCEICSKLFKNYRSLSGHIRVFHKISTEDYYIEYIGEKGICPECGNFTKFISISKGFQNFCSRKCSNESESKKESFKQTCLEKYGTDNVFQNKEIQKKYKQTCLDKYGVDHNMKIKQVKENKKQTCLKKYGVDHPSKSEVIKEKKKRTCLKNYGVEYPIQSEEVKERIKNTCLDKYGFFNPAQSEEVKEKRKENTIIRYGVESTNQLYSVQEKKKQTCLERYGVDNPSKLKEFKKKINNKIKKYYFERLLNSDRLKEKCVPLFKEEDYKGVEIKYPFKCTKCNTNFEDHLNDGHIPRCPKCYPPYRSIFEQEVSSFCKQYFPNLIENDRTVLEGNELDIYISSINMAIECNGTYWHSEEQGKDKYYHLNKTLKCQDKGIKLIHIFEDEWTSNKNRIKKILLKEMNIIPRETNFKDKMIVDRRFSDGNYLLENGYEMVKSIEPICYYSYNNKRSKKEINNSNKIWDCGKLVFSYQRENK